MKTRIVLLVVVGLCLAADSKPDSKKEDKDLIQGSWTLVSGEKDGEQPPEEIKMLKITFKDDKITAATSKDTHEGKFKLDPTKKPRQLSLSMSINGQDKEIPGIYELDGDNLKLCIPDGDGSDAPKEFTGKQGSKQVLLVLKRAK
jgi:uncharacterized protein (TIGR03067 family)